MIRGLYSGAAGLRTELTRLTIMSNNLSNASTPGYKEDVASVGSFPRLLLSRVVDGGHSAGLVGGLGTGAGIRQEVMNLRQGSLMESARELDLALEGPGFFALQTPDGVRYTRDGSFQRSADGQLVSAQGYPVLGENGPIALPQGQVRVQSDGAVILDGQELARLQVVDFPAETEFQKGGDNLLQADGGVAAEGTAVRQFALEASNVDAVHLMVNVIAASRAYESNQRLLQIQDQTLERAVNDVGRV